MSSVDGNDEKYTSSIDSIAHAMDSLPMIWRLEYVKNVIFDHGGAMHSAPRNIAMLTAYKVLQDVIGHIKKNPEINRSLETPAP